ncbi:MAG: SDR family NAD(P)-dependent oxidoreductase [Alphaproteobacteria bacterium]|nr:SDR family NAD(P)-dependent oxidoreductase [Alphaproteobacteria bacterium]
MTQSGPRKGSVLISGVGAGQGLGAAIARRFSREGYPVVIAGRSQDKLQVTLKELNDGSAQAVMAIGDSTLAADVRRFVETAEGLAPLAVAVHNAGSNEPAPFLKVSEERFTRHWREHALGGFLLAQAAIPKLLQHGGGSLFFTGASGSLRGKANFAPFAAAKAAMRNLAQSIAREYGPQNIHIGHIVVDGGIDGDLLNSRLPDRKKQLGPDGMLNVDAIADAYWAMHIQHRSAWTLELDVRPWTETF